MSHYRTHDLKTWPPYFRDVLEGRKVFEVRWNDRDYRVGDVLHLREFDPQRGPTGGNCYRWVSYVLHGDNENLPGFGLRPGFVVLSLCAGVGTSMHHLAIGQHRPANSECQHWFCAEVCSLTPSDVQVDPELDLTHAGGEPGE